MLEYGFLNISNLFYYNYLIFCEQLFLVGFFLVIIGILSFLMIHNNLLIIFMAMELILLGFSLQYIAVSLYTETTDGFIFVLVLITLAAAEAALGLSVIVNYHRINKTIKLDSLTKVQE